MEQDDSTLDNTTTIERPTPTEPVGHWKWPGLRGRADNRNGWVSLRVGDSHVALGIPFTEANKSKAKRELEKIQRARRERRQAERLARKYGIGAIAPAEEPKPDPAEVAAISIFEAQNVFKARFLKKKPEGTRRKYLHLFEIIFPVDGPLTKATIDQAVQHWLATTTYADGTKRERYFRIKRFVRFCKDHGWITVNPLDLEPPPSAYEDDEVIVYSPEDVRRVIVAYEAERYADAIAGETNRWARNRAQRPDLIRFYYHTGCRNEEAASLKWAEYVIDLKKENYVTDTAIVWNKAKNGPRQFPLGPFPELAAILQRQRAFAEANDGWVFPWRSHTSVTTPLRATLKALKIPTSNRQVHVFRATREAIWRDAGMPKETRLALIGHTEKAYKDAYETVTPAAVYADELVKSGWWTPSKERE